MNISQTKGFFKFLILTLLGIVFLLIPFRFENGMDTILFHYLKLFISENHAVIQTIVVLLVCLSATLSLIDQLLPNTILRKQRLLKKLFSTTPFYVFNRIMGAIIAMLCYLQIGPKFIISIDQTLILEFGAMEFLGQLIGFIAKPLFKLSEICAVNIISAWVGPGNAAIIGTKELFEKGYFTVKESAVIGSQFSISSIGWVVLVCSVLDTMDHFALIFLGITLIGIILAFINVRIPPISNYPDTYVDGSTTSKIVSSTQGTRLQRAIIQSSMRANQVTLKNFTSKIDNMSFYVLWLTPIIIFWGALALIVSLYTPLLTWVSYPIELVLKLANISEPAITASAIMSGFADNYLPVILGKGLESIESKTIITMMSILQLIFMSEIATLLQSCKVVKSFKDIIIIFLQRTIIALPFVIIFTKLIL